MFLQVRNNKRTAILAIQSDSKKKNLDPKAKKEKLFTIYRPNTGQAVKLETLSNLRKKFKKVQCDEAEASWNQQYNFSASKCSHAYWNGNCKTVTFGGNCEVGRRKKNYNVLTGSVLSVWTQVEDVLSRETNLKGQNARMQVCLFLIHSVLNCLKMSLFKTLRAKRASLSKLRNLNFGVKNSKLDLNATCLDL